MSTIFELFLFLSFDSGLRIIHTYHLLPRKHQTGQREREGRLTATTGNGLHQVAKLATESRVAVDNLVCDLFFLFQNDIRD